MVPYIQLLHSQSEVKVLLHFNIRLGPSMYYVTADSLGLTSQTKPGHPRPKLRPYQCLVHTPEHSLGG